MSRSLSPAYSGEMGEYLARHCTGPDEVQRSLIEVTQQATGGAAGMQIGVDQGVFLEIITRSMGVRTAIEIGTFTGYSSLAIARGMGPGGRLICCDVSDEWTDIGRRHWEAAGVAERIELHLAPALHTLADLPPELRVDLAFIDADKHNYLNYYEAILPHLHPKGMILVDNTLWGGTVLDSHRDDLSEGRNADRMAIRAFNDRVTADGRVRSVILPLGDGVTMIQPV